MQAARSQLADIHDVAQKAISVREPQEWIALQSSLAAPTAEKVQAWSQQELIALFLIACTTLFAGCNTVAGAGEDISKGGQAIHNTAEQAK